jgi:hypothetical protein
MTTIDRDHGAAHDHAHAHAHAHDAHEHPHDHAHSPDDPHGHGHGHDVEHEQHLSGAGTSERAFGGPVTVDVGGGAGALVLLLGDDWLEDEVHLRPVGADRPSTHTGVWVRRVPSGDVVAAVFGSLPTGAYAVLDHDRSTVMADVDVADGAVVEIDLRGRSPR